MIRITYTVPYEGENSQEFESFTAAADFLNHLSPADFDSAVAEFVGGPIDIYKLKSYKNE